MSINCSVVIAPSVWLAKLKTLIKPYDDYDSTDDKILKSLGFSMLCVYGVVLRAYFRHKSTFSIGDRQATNFLLLVTFIPVIASIAVCPKNIVPVLLWCSD